MPQQPGMPSSSVGVPLGWIVLHEVGHIFGLGHVSAADQVMTNTNPVVDVGADGVYDAVYAAGDLAGLRRVGAGQGCMTTPRR